MSRKFLLVYKNLTIHMVNCRRVFFAEETGRLTVFQGNSDSTVNDLFPAQR